MAAGKNAERINRLTTYVDKLEAALKGSVPEKHKNSVESWKQMLEIDIKKTKLTIDSLKIGG